MFKKYCNVIHPDGKNYFAIYGAGEPIQLANVPASQETYDQLKEYNDKGYDIYTVIQPSVGFKDADVRGSRWYIADWDAGRKDSGEIDEKGNPKMVYYSDSEVAAIKEAKLEEFKQLVKDKKMLMPTMVVDSRNGFHIYYEVADPYTIAWAGDIEEDFETTGSDTAMSIYRATILSISKHLGTDPIIVNPGRVLRVAGLEWRKMTENLAPKLTTIRLYNESNIYTSNQIIEAFPLDEECIAMATTMKKPRSSNSQSNGSYNVATAGTWYIVHNNGSKAPDGKSYIEVEGKENVTGGQIHAGCSIGNDPAQHDIVVRSGDWAYCNADGCKCGCYATQNKDDLFEVKKDKMWEEINIASTFDDLSQGNIDALQSIITFKGSDSTPQEYFSNIVKKREGGDIPLWGDNDDIFIDSPLSSDVDFDHTEKALKNFLDTKKSAIESDIKGMIGDKFYNYLYSMTEQIGITQKDILPFFIYNCSGVLTGNAITVEWITNYKTYLNTFSCVNALPGSGKSPLQDVFIKETKNTYENSEAIEIAKKALSAINKDDSTNNTFVDEGPQFDFDDDIDLSNDDVVPTDPNAHDAPQVTKRSSFIIDNTTPEARISTMGKCGYAFQVGSELTQYMSGAYGDPTDQAAQQNKYYSGASVNVTRVSRANEKVPNCCMSILTEGQDDNVQNLYSSNFVGMGFTPRFDIIKMGRRRSSLSCDKADPVVKQEFDNIMLAFADNRLIVSNKDADIVIDANIPEDRLVNKKCMYKGQEYIILFSKYMGNYFNLLLSRVMKPLNSEVEGYILSRHKNEIEKVIEYSDVVSMNIDCILQKTTERLLKYIGITSLIRYTFGQKSYIDYDKTDVNIAINYYYYALYHNMVNEYKHIKVDTDMQKIVGKIYSIFKKDGSNTKSIEWSAFGNSQLVRAIGKEKFRKEVLKATEKEGLFKEVVSGKKVAIVLMDRSRIESYLKKGTVK